jgi:hypothetical protein
MRFLKNRAFSCWHYLLVFITNEMIAQEQAKEVKLHSIELGLGAFNNKN